MTSLTLWPFAIGFLPYLFVHSAPENQAGSNAPPPPANHGCRLAGVFFWSRKYVWPFLALAKWIGTISCYFCQLPLMVMALSVPFLDEPVEWRRCLAVGCGFVGVLMILQPGLAAFGSNEIIPLCATALMATDGVLTRFATRRDNAMTSFFWTGIAGAIALICVTLFFLHPPQGADWWWMALLCITGASGHYCLISRA